MFKVYRRKALHKMSDQHLVSSDYLPQDIQPVVSPGYHDPWTWWYKLYAVWISAIHFVVGGALIFGPPQLTRSNSLETLHDLCHVPWPAWGIVFVLLGFGIIAGSELLIFKFPNIGFKGTKYYKVINDLKLHPRKVCYLISATISGVFELASLIWTVLPGKTTNPVVVGFSTLSVLAMISGARYCEMQETQKRIEDIITFDYKKHL